MSHEEKRREIRSLFLTLWDKAVDAPDYDKAQWMRLEHLLGINSPGLYVVPDPDQENN